MRPLKTLRQTKKALDVIELIVGLIEQDLLAVAVHGV